MHQSQPLRIENPEHISFTTSKTVQGKLWLVNNRRLEERVLGYVAKYQEKFGVTLYSLVFQGNHLHTVSQFPNRNRALFFRDLNARTAEAVRACVPTFGSGPLYARRYAEQAVVTNADIEEQFFYSALQPVAAGLCERIGDYPGYNSVWDAINGIERKCKVFDGTGFFRAKRAGLKPKVEDFTTVYYLKFSRLPGYEHLSAEEYRSYMLNELERRRIELVQEWKAKGHRFLTKAELRRVVAGSHPKTTKTSARHDKRPLVLTKHYETKKAFLAWYFGIYNWYKHAVKKFFAGNLSIPFPPGTYRPPGLLIQAT